MKKKTIIIVSIISIIFLFAAYYYLSKPATKPPEHLANIPKQAQWVGGADGGIWYQITKVISKKEFKIKVYNEGTGGLEIDTTFVLNPDCSFKEIDSTFLVKSINGYDGEKILLSLPEKGKRCSLIIR